MKPEDPSESATAEGSEQEAKAEEAEPGGDRDDGGSHTVEDAAGAVPEQESEAQKAAGQ
jgi:hypothetical protein